MNLVKKKPFEFLILILVVYYCLIVIFFEPVILPVKTSFIMSAFGVWVLSVLFGFAFGREIDKVKESVLKIFYTGNGSKGKVLKKLAMLALLSLVIITITSMSEYMISSIFIKGGSVAIGFPLSIYSFSVGRFLFLNLITDMVLNISVLFFLGSVLMKDAKKI